ncbi:MAG: hypothetical protein ACRD1K_19680 [Acidimicrobiales bacterium]
MPTIVVGGGNPSVPAAIGAGPVLTGLAIWRASVSCRRVGLAWRAALVAIGVALVLLPATGAAGARCR